MTTVLKKLILGSFALLLVASVSGCNTVKGMGRDVQGGGEGMENAADEVHEDIQE